MRIQERTGAGNNRSATSAQPAMGERLPTPPRERKPALAALAVLLVLVGALGATMLVLRAGDRVEVVKVTSDIQAGESVGGHVTSVLVADDTSINYVKWNQLTALKKLKAKSPIYKGTVVIGDMFAEGAELPAGKASVGVSLKEGQYPSGIKSGDTVAVYRVGDTTTSGSRSSGSSNSSGSGSSSADAAPIVEQAKVISVKSDSDSTISSTNLPVTLMVDSGQAAAVAAAASAGQVALVIVPGN
ncbi:RcpC/CpaB family pilus assembly protein [Streptomyces sp. NPDC059445]|uniref:RcpC/CpaB family pilus assembly protein n=1 Tax=Streptomyces sp. NPDC059445 TaxID=3346832 RepID=UPI00368250DD